MAKINLESKFVIFALIFFLLAFIALNAYGFYNKEYVNNPIIKNNISSFDAEYVYKFYVTYTPNINGRSYYGSPNASITFIGFLDVESKASRYFIEEIFPNFKEEFINTGKVRFYNKNYLTFQDIADKNNKLIFALNLLCVESVKKEAYYPFYFDMFKLNGTEGLQLLREKYKIPKDEFNICLKGQDIHNLIIDAAEIENFGMLGITPRFYIGLDGRDNTALDGVPKYIKFKRTIRQYEVTLGE